MQYLSSLAGDNKPLLFVLVFIAVVAAASGAIALFRIVFSRRLRVPGSARARQPRLGLVDTFDLDRQRQLILVRRDNVEHLIMIGGPNDVVVETEIVRAQTAGALVQGASAREREPVVGPPSSPAPQARLHAEARPAEFSEPEAAPQRRDEPADTAPSGASAAERANEPPTPPASRPFPPRAPLGSQPVAPATAPSVDPPPLPAPRSAANPAPAAQAVSRPPTLRPSLAPLARATPTLKAEPVPETGTTTSRDGLDAAAGQPALTPASSVSTPARAPIGEVSAAPSDRARALPPAPSPRSSPTSPGAFSGFRRSAAVSPDQAPRAPAVATSADLPAGSVAPASPPGPFAPLPRTDGDVVQRRSSAATVPAPVPDPQKESAPKPPLRLPQTTSATIESLEEEMAKLLGRPIQQK